MSKKRILQISVTAGQDTTGMLAASLHSISRLMHPWESMLAYGRGSVESHHLPAVKIARPIDLAIHGAATRLFDRHALVRTPADRRLRSLVEEYRPDLIHIHNIHGYYLSLGALAQTLRQANVPVVMTLHDLWPLTGHCAVAGDCTGFEHGCNCRCPNVRHYPAAWMQSKAADNFRRKQEAFASIPDLHLVVPSQFMADAVARSHLAHRPLTIIPNGVNPKIRQTVNPDALGRYPVRPDGILLVAHTWTADKGLDLLNDFIRRFPDKIAITIVGRLPKGFNLPKRVRHLAKANPSQLSDLYSRNRLVVVPSRGESFSMVKAEALSCQTPVVAFADAGGVAEGLTPWQPGDVIPDKAVGLSVSPHTAEALAAAVTHSIKHRFDREAILQFALEHYSWPDMLHRYFELYKSLLNT